MKIAITGASGFLGSYLVNFLSKEGHDLLLFTRSSAKTGILNYPEPKIHWIKTDYSFESLRKPFSKVHALVHLSSKRYDPRQKMFSDYKSNIDISKNIFSACETEKIKNVIFSSSRSIYSNIHKIPLSEEDPVDPENPYSISKLKIEKMSEFYDINCKSLRIAQLIGWGEREGFMFKTFLTQAMNKEPLTIFGEGSGKRDYLYAKDAATAIGKAIQFPDIKGVFNVGSGLGTSHLELAHLMSQVFSDNKSMVIMDREKKEDSSDYRLDINKFKAAFNWTPQYSLEEMFIDMKQDYQTKRIPLLYNI